MTDGRSNSCLMPKCNDYCVSNMQMANTTTITYREWQNLLYWCHGWMRIFPYNGGIQHSLNMKLQIHSVVLDGDNYVVTHTPTPHHMSTKASSRPLDKGEIGKRENRNEKRKSKKKKREKRKGQHTEKKKNKTLFRLGSSSRIIEIIEKDHPPLIKKKRKGKKKPRLETDKEESQTIGNISLPRSD